MNQTENYLIHPFTSQIYFFIALIAFGTISHLITSPPSKFSKLLSSKVLVHFGLISYGMYLYHWPILVLLKRITTDILLITFIGMGLTYIVSLLSYITIEKYFRSNKSRILNWMLEFTSRLHGNIQHNASCKPIISKKQ